MDDQRAGRGGHQWSIGPQALRQILSSGSYHVYPGHRTDSGKFTIGRRRNWLYSQRLFPEADMLQDALRDVIEAAIAKIRAGNRRRRLGSLGNPKTAGGLPTRSTLVQLSRRPAEIGDMLTWSEPPSC